MKIFNRGNDTKAGAPQAAAATVQPAPAAAPAPTAPVAAPAPAAQPAPAPAPAAPAAPDLSVILDANVKEMSEKIARLASSLESAQQERSGFEAKIEQMEDRMRKLSSLTEMISAQYNPFVGDAPTERGEVPRPDVGLAPPALAAPVSTLTLPPPPVEAPPAVVAAPAMPDFGTLPPFEAPPEPLAVAPEPAPAPAPAFALPSFAAPAPAVHDEGHGQGHAQAQGEDGVYLWNCPPGFESSMLLLGWADMLLKSAGSRESLLALVNYYHNIGWIGDPARDQILAYADGLTPPAAGEPTDWRADVEVHEKSLLFVEKLRAVSRRSG